MKLFLFSLLICLVAFTGFNYYQFYFTKINLFILFYFFIKKHLKLLKEETSMIHFLKDNLSQMKLLIKVYFIYKVSIVKYKIFLI